jgi:beta-carotene 15,15'-dioxygenase
MHTARSIDVAVPPQLRLWALPFLTAVLLSLDLIVGTETPFITMFAAAVIVLAGIPHGTLDIEIAAARFALPGQAQKIAVILTYAGCAAIMFALWEFAPAASLTLFLIVSIIHFSADWRGGNEPFLAMMVGWAIIALPALSHPAAVADIFQTLTGSANGRTIAAVLACAAMPAALGSLVYIASAIESRQYQAAANIISCLVAALFLPPLIAFSVFFCGLHSPRHMRDALRETAGMKSMHKIAIILAVLALSVGMGALFMIGDAELALDNDIVRAGFILLSALTVPHFILEHLLANSRQSSI